MTLTAEKEQAPAASATRAHIRGSMVLLAGRVVALGASFLVQVLTVRYLAKSDYGAFAYALSAISIGATVALFGLDKAVARFLPIYHERGQHDRLFGAIVMTFATIVGIGLAIAFLLFGLRGMVTDSVVNDPLAMSLLLLMIALAPIQALDSWFEGLLAVFASPRAILVRRYLLGPGLKLGAVLLVILTRGTVHLLAAGYLVGGILGFLTYSALLRKVLKDQGLWQRLDPRRLVMPFREIFGFSTPLLTSDAASVFRSSLVVVLLEALASTTAVAEFQAVWPIARLNLFVMQSFKYLFTPLAARLFARDDASGINDLYWQTATWIALFSFPVFAVTFSLARPLTVMLFGSRYADSGVILAVLALGNYFNAALGFNAYTLRVYGKVAYIMAIDLLSLVIGLALNLWLIPLYGALGAAAATTAALVIYNLLNHAGLMLGTQIKLFQARYLWVYASLIAAAAGLFALQHLVDPPIVVGVIAAAAVSLLLIRLNRSVMNVAQMFPEIMRLPFAGRLFA